MSSPQQKQNDKILGKNTTNSISRQININSEHTRSLREFIFNEVTSIGGLKTKLSVTY